MIYLSGLDSIIESIYLGEQLNPKLGTSSIFINPDEIKYMTNKLVIITKNDYSEANIDFLLKNRNKIISRIYTDNENVEVQPYIMRINENLMWNGKILNDLDTLDNLIIQSKAEYEENTGKLYFPKINLDKEDRRLMDNYNNLTCLGWALHQVGINLKDCPFINMDYLKLQKVIF